MKDAICDGWKSGWPNTFESAVEQLPRDKKRSGVRWIKGEDGVEDRWNGVLEAGGLYNWIGPPFNWGDSICVQSSHIWAQEVHWSCSSISSWAGGYNYICNDWLIRCIYWASIYSILICWTSLSDVCDIGTFIVLSSFCFSVLVFFCVVLFHIVFCVVRSVRPSIKQKLRHNPNSEERTQSETVCVVYSSRLYRFGGSCREFKASRQGTQLWKLIACVFCYYTNCCVGFKIDMGVESWECKLNTCWFSGSRESSITCELYGKNAIYRLVN